MSTTDDAAAPAPTASRLRPAVDRRTLPLSERVARVAGRDVRYQVTGRGAPVVLVHGLSGSYRWWARTLPALAAQYTVYLVDLPGFGALHRHPQRLPLPELAAWLIEWLDAVQLPPTRLVGHSMGGALAIQAALQRPDAICQLVLVAPAAIPAGHQTLRSYLLPLVAALPATSPSFLPILAYDALRSGPRTLLHFARALLTQDASTELARIGAPTLLVWGQRDTLVPPALGARMQQSIPLARLVVLEGAGHVVMYDRADAFNAALLDFFAHAAPMTDNRSCR